MTKILTDAEVAEIRTRVRTDNAFGGGGYTWKAIEALCDTVEALRKERDEERDDSLLNAAKIMCGGCGGGHELRVSTTRMVSGSLIDIWSHYGRRGQFIGECRASPLHAARSASSKRESADAIQIADRTGHIVTVAREHRAEVES